MYRLLLMSMLLLITSSAWSQQNNPSAHYANEAAILVTNDTESVSRFELTATPEQVAQIKEELAKYQREFTFDAQEKTNGNYSCRLWFSHPIDNRYLHKILTVMEVEKVSIGTTDYTRDQLLTIGQ